MPTGPALLLYAAVFLAVLFLVEAFSALDAARRARRATLLRRMDGPDPAAAEGAESLRRQRRRGLVLIGPWAGLSKRLDRLIRHAGLAVSVRRTLLVMAVLSGAAAASVVVLAPGLTGHGWPALAAAAGAGGLVLPLLVIARIKRRRLKLAAGQLPDALELMARSLQAGHPISAAMTLVAKEMPDPLGAEFGLAVDEMTYGLDLREALANLRARTPLEDLQYVIVSINVQHETGGNLAEVLHGLSRVIRERYGMLKKIKALSSEARMSAKLLAVMPLVFGGLVFAARPEFFTDVAGDPLFLPLLGLAVGLELIGILVMQRLVNFRV